MLCSCTNPLNVERSCLAVGRTEKGVVLYVTVRREPDNLCSACASESGEGRYGVGVRCTVVAGAKGEAMREAVTELRGGRARTMGRWAGPRARSGASA